jgi:hypothetical protein
MKYVTWTEDVRYAYIILDGKPEGKNSLERPRYR